MPIINRFADLHAEITEWRRDFHRHPELLYDVHRTAGIVEEKLRSFGLDEVVPGIGRTGVVGVLKGRRCDSGRVIGLRADMDALPIDEMTGKDYASVNPGVMHACGHDGHTAMLLGAAKYLAETRNFDGTVVLLFQPAEEGGAGGKAMVDDGVMERFNIQEVYGMHNFPSVPVGEFAMRPGPLMAAADQITIQIEGCGGHAARPHCTVDPIVVAAHMVTALQTVASRSVDPLKSVVVSICKMSAGNAYNVIPPSATLLGTVRTLDPEVRDIAEAHIRRIVESTGAAFGATATCHYSRDYPVTVNNPEKTEFAAAIAREVAGADRVDTDYPPVMGGEDFSFMLEARPGAYVFIGNGDTAPVHHPEYDFNDEIIPLGCSYFVRAVETAMPAP